MRFEYKEFAKKLENGGVEQFEETYPVFSRLLLTKLNKEEICFVYSDYDNLEMVERYIANLGLNVRQKILISNLNDPLCEILRVAVNNSVWAIPQGNQMAKYWECYRHLDDECWVNCGSATGDTIVKYFYSGYGVEKIYAYEGDSSVFENLKSIVGAMPEEFSSKIEMINQFLGTENNKGNFNEIFADKKVTLINMDIEGAEMPVLRGTSEVIKRQRPVLAICAYHKASDLIEIPAFVQSVSDDYVFYLRKYIGYEPGALNEYLYYCVPKERMI